MVKTRCLSRRFVSSEYDPTFDETSRLAQNCQEVAKINHFAHRLKIVVADLHAANGYQERGTDGQYNK